MRSALLLAAAAGMGVAIACSSNDTAPPPGAASDDAGTPETPEASAAADSAADAPAQASVTFRYRPSWDGVVSVEVVGAFGQPGDWTQPLVTLAPDGSGGFTGTAALAPRDYLYVFKVTGDAQAAKPDQFVRYAFDPASSAFAACPQASPTYDKNAPNPCSQITVPASGQAAMYHLRGKVILAGAAASGYLVEVERMEKQSHHFFANRATSSADGTFDLAVAVGQWRLQVLHPTFLQQTDAQRDPLANSAVRRAISGAMQVGSDATLEAVDVKYDSYPAMAPHGDGGVLPTTFAFQLLSDAKTARVAVYGPGMNVGDPWFISPSSTAANVTFDGGFNTNKAPPDAGAVVPGTRYFWGTEQDLGEADAGIPWTAQSMVFPITWQ